MKRILLRSGKSPFEVVSPEQMMYQNTIGTNSGNLLFSDAVHKILLTENTEITSNRFRFDLADTGRINDEYDVFVVPLANAFRANFAPNLNKLSAFIEKLTIPVVVIGVGAQAALDSETSALSTMNDAVTRFVRATLERSASIGVRGEFTARYLADLGFKDDVVDIIGCPSMFLGGDTFTVRRPAGPLRPDARVAINGSWPSLRYGNVPGLMTRTYQSYPDTTYIAQNLRDAELMYWGDTSEASETFAGVPSHRTHPWMRDNKVRLYLDPTRWIDDLRAYDYSLGGRIHGNIAALLAGTPVTVVCHDSRTLELCRYFDIPHVSNRDITPETTAAELYERVDVGKLMSGHKERYDRFISFLDRQNLENVFSHGDGGAAFDARIKEIDFPPPIQVWDGSDDGALGYRTAWLRQQALQAAKEHNESAELIRDLARKNTQLAKANSALAARVTALESGRRPSLYRRARRAVGRLTR